MKKFIVAALVIGIVATIINDVGRYLSALSALDSGTQQIAVAAAQAARRDHNRTQPGGKAAVAAAKQRDLELYGYQVQDREIQVWTRDTVEGTWIAGPFLAWQAGKPLDTPVQVTEHDSAYIR